MFFTAGHAVQIRREPGHRIPEYILPTDRDDPALWRSGYSSVFTRGAVPGAYSTSDIPRTGTIEYPLVLVDFNDLHFTSQDKNALMERYERIFNEQNYSDTATYIFHGKTIHGATGSVSDYFRDQSYGQYTPKFKIIGPITLSKGYAYYGSGKYDNVQQLVIDICDSIITYNLANLSGYARQGTIDQLSIIYAGRGENYYGSDPKTIWPQAASLAISRKDSIIYNTGIRGIRYACTCELYWSSDSILDGIGTFCHEFSHTLGLPDFYNPESDSKSETDAAMGYWSIMDYGNYDNEGFSPVGYTAFEKYSLGWMDLEDISFAGNYALNDISCKPDPDAGIHTAYRLNTGNNSQFIILENHIKTGWYKYHATEGLMVTAVDYNQNSWESNRVYGSSKHYSILPADNKYDRSSNSGDLYPYKNVDSITVNGTPQLKAGSSYPSFSIYYIARKGDLVTFRAGYDLITNLESPRLNETSINVSDGVLSVTAPTGSTVTIHDISGKIISVTTTTEPTQQITLPGHGIWIVKCGNITRKVRL